MPGSRLKKSRHPLLPHGRGSEVVASLKSSRGIRLGMIRNVAVSLVLGVITTIAIAWGLALAFDPAGGKIIGSVSWTARAGSTWWVWTFSGPGTEMVQYAFDDRKSSPIVETVVLSVPSWS